MTQIIEVLPTAKTFKAIRYDGENIDQIHEFIDLPMAQDVDDPKKWKVHKTDNQYFFLTPGDYVYIAPNGFKGVWIPSVFKRNWLIVTPVTTENQPTNVS